MKRPALAVLVAAGLLLNLPAASANPSEASAASMLSTAVVTGGASALVHGSGRFVVTAMETVGESTLVVLHDASGAAQASLRMATGMVGNASLVVGSVVEVVTHASGRLLVASGKVIAFVPNELGRALVGSSRARERP